MSSTENERRKKRIERLKIELIIVVCVLLLIPNIVCIVLMIKQAHLQNEIDNLQTQIYELLLRVSEEDYERQSRLVDLEVAGVEDDWDSFYENQALLADNWDNLENVVWSFSDNGEREIHKVYLTFDDGPSIYTEEILDILDEYDVKATFFVVGKTDEHSLEMYKEIVERGHTLGMHSYSHVYADIYASKEAFMQDFEEIYSLLYDTTGIEPLFYRFPGGSSNTVSSVDIHLLIDFLNEKGITHFDWNVASGDASSNYISAETIISNSVSGIENRDTSVVLLHDLATKKSTVEALPSIIEYILDIDNTEILPITSDTELIQHVW